MARAPNSDIYVGCHVLLEERVQPRELIVRALLVRLRVALEDPEELGVVLADLIASQRRDSRLAALHHDVLDSNITDWIDSSALVFTHAAA